MEEQGRKLKGWWLFMARVLYVCVVLVCILLWPFAWLHEKYTDMKIAIRNGWL
jgi:hypothetical protein